LGLGRLNAARFWSHSKLGTLDLIDGVDYQLELYQVRVEDLVRFGFRSFCSRRLAECENAIERFYFELQQLGRGMNRISFRDGNFSESDA
jgi:hypothetical protein